MSIKSRMVNCVRTTVMTAVFLAAGLSVVQAVELPDTACFSVQYPVPGATSYLKVQAGGLPPFEAWCVDTDNTISQDDAYTGKIYEISDPAVGGLFDYPAALNNLDLVLYILNQEYPGKPFGAGVYTYGDVQRAIWQLLEDNPSNNGLGEWSQTRVDAILLDAKENGDRFVPGCGQITVLFLNPVLEGCDTTTDHLGTIAQVIIIEVPVECASIGDFVWYDMNNNGIQEAGEPGVGGVTVNLLDCAGNLLATTQTGGDGYYGFTGLIPDDYLIQVVAPTGYNFSPANQGANDSQDSDADANGIMTCTTLVAGEDDPTWDAGLYRPENPGTGTPGYWKNHPEAWPVETIVIGGKLYTKAQAIAMLKTAEGGDKRLTLFRALVCATLNVMIGNDSSCIADTITAANTWWARYSSSPVKGSSRAWKVGEPLYRAMDDYNNGLLCAPHRD